MRYRFLLFLVVALAFGGCGGARMDGRLVKQYGGEKTRPDQVALRSIVLLHPQSGERLNLTYYHDGAYDPGALQKIDRLFRDRHTGEVGDIDPELIDYLVDIRRRLGLPSSVVFEILSGYRSPMTNARLRQSNGQVAKESFHMRGWAVDFRISKVNGRAIAEIAKTMQRGGVSYYPSSNHVHVDLGNIRTWATK
ncbi:MAG: YcbK family protein [Bdellovibrionales bacterium]